MTASYTKWVRVLWKFNNFAPRGTKTGKPDGLRRFPRAAVTKKRLRADATAGRRPEEILRREPARRDRAGAARSGQD